MKWALLLCFVCVSQVTTASDDLLKQGINLYEQREDLNNVYKALDIFNQYIKQNPSAPEGYWRASMANYYIGHLIEGRRKRKRYYQQGINHANKCIELTGGKLVDCHFWLGTNVALLKQEKGILSMAFGLDEIFAHFEKCKELDPTYASSGPYRMLALLSYKAPGFLGGNNDKAYNYIKKAIETSPNEPLNVLFHAQFLVDDGKEEEALKLINSFIQKADPKKFAFYESHNAFKNINHFLKHKKWLEKD